VPNPLLHYSLSVLFAKTLGLSSGKAIIIGIAGVLPDLDVLAKAHRGATHSLLLSLLLLVAMYAVHARLALIAALLYTLHNIVDFFNGPAPILWPITSTKYWLKIELVASLNNTMSTKLSMMLLRNPKPPRIISALSGETLAITIITLVILLVAG
jgi:membrane-bound metal-dependent hydrolase YbcI (DUF457 family)